MANTRWFHVGRALPRRDDRGLGMDAPHRRPLWPSALCVSGLGLGSFGLFGLWDLAQFGSTICSGECGPLPWPDPRLLLAIAIVGGLLFALGGLLDPAGLPRSRWHLARAVLCLVLGGGISAVAVVEYWPILVRLGWPNWTTFYYYFPVFVAAAVFLFVEGAWLWLEPGRAVSSKDSTMTR